MWFPYYRRQKILIREIRLCDIIHKDCWIPISDYNTILSENDRQIRSLVLEDEVKKFKFLLTNTNLIELKEGAVCSSRPMDMFLVKFLDP